MSLKSRQFAQTPKMYTQANFADEDLSLIRFDSPIREKRPLQLDPIYHGEEEPLRYQSMEDMPTGDTLEHIGELLGVSRERVRQIEAKALRKLRRVADRQGLHIFLEG